MVYDLFSQLYLLLSYLFLSLFSAKGGQVIKPIIFVACVPLNEKNLLFSHYIVNLTIKYGST